MIRDLTGQRFSRLVVLERVGKTKSGSATWRCQCDCGNTVIRSSQGLIKGTTQSCNCLRGNHKALPFGEAALNDLFYSYNRKAQQRNLIFNLSRDEFKILINQKCYYCGIEPSRIHKVNKRVGFIVCNGIDRINNNIGYELSNCVACCYECNRMKHSMTKEAFLMHIKRIYEVQNNIGRRSLEI